MRETHPPRDARLHRRNFLVGSAALCLSPCCAIRPVAAKTAIPVITALADRGGCSLLSGEIDEIDSATGGIDYGGDDFLPTSGDPGLDRALGAALVRLSQLFNERPGFGFYDDTDAQNAFATPDTKVPGTWGTVLFGTTMFWDLVKGQNDEGISVLAVVAHEFGHIVQFHRGLRAKLLEGQRTVKRNELHADYLSGFFLGNRKRDNPAISLLAAGAEFRAIGDNQMNAKDHHGTPDERIRAAEAGYKLGFAGDSLDKAISEGMRYALAL